MARYPYAAQQLIAQVQDKFKNATAEPDDDPDGLDVHRAFKFNPQSSAWLAPVLDVIVPQDNRIVSSVMRGKNLVVTFTGGNEADLRTEFPLIDVANVLNKDK